MDSAGKKKEDAPAEAPVEPVSDVSEKKEDTPATPAEAPVEPVSDASEKKEPAVATSAAPLELTAPWLAMYAYADLRGAAGDGGRPALYLFRARTDGSAADDFARAHTALRILNPRTYEWRADFNPSTLAAQRPCVFFRPTLPAAADVVLSDDALESQLLDAGRFAPDVAVMLEDGNIERLSLALNPTTGKSEMNAENRAKVRKAQQQCPFFASCNLLPALETLLGSWAQQQASSSPLSTFALDFSVADYVYMFLCAEPKPAAAATADITYFQAKAQTTWKQWAVRTVWGDARANRATIIRETFQHLLANKTNAAAAAPSFALFHRGAVHGGQAGDPITFSLDLQRLLYDAALCTLVRPKTLQRAPEMAETGDQYEPIDYIDVPRRRSLMFFREFRLMTSPTGPAGVAFCIIRFGDKSRYNFVFCTDDPKDNEHVLDYVDGKFTTELVEVPKDGQQERRVPLRTFYRYYQWSFNLAHANENVQVLDHSFSFRPVGGGTSAHELISARQNIQALALKDPFLWTAFLQFLLYAVDEGALPWKPEANALPFAKVEWTRQAQVAPTPDRSFVVASPYIALVQTGTDVQEYFALTDEKSAVALADTVVSATAATTKALGPAQEVSITAVSATWANETEGVSYDATQEPGALSSTPSGPFSFGTDHAVGFDDDSFDDAHTFDDNDDAGAWTDASSVAASTEPVHDPAASEAAAAAAAAPPAASRTRPPAPVPATTPTNSDVAAAATAAAAVSSSTAALPALFSPPSSAPPAKQQQQNVILPVDARALGDSVSDLLYHGVPFFVPLFFLFSSVVAQDVKGLVYAMGLVTTVVLCFVCFLLVEYLWVQIAGFAPGGATTWSAAPVLTTTAHTLVTQIEQSQPFGSSVGTSWLSSSSVANKKTGTSTGPGGCFQLVYGQVNYARNVNIALVVLAYTFMYLLTCAVTQGLYRHGYADFPRYGSMFVVFLALGLHNFVVSSARNCGAGSSSGPFGKIGTDLLSVAFGAFFGALIARAVAGLGVPSLVYYSADDEADSCVADKQEHNITCST